MAGQLRLHWLNVLEDGGQEPGREGRAGSVRFSGG